MWSTVEQAKGGRLETAHGKICAKFGVGSYFETLAALMMKKSAQKKK
jgi:hypothetical protein